MGLFCGVSSSLLHLGPSEDGKNPLVADCGQFAAYLASKIAHIAPDLISELEV